MEINIDFENLKKHLITNIRQWFDENGKNCNAIIGISGGKDSTVAAALCVEALGKERVIGILMPNGEQKDISDSKKVCELLDIEHYVVNIEESYNAIYKPIFQFFEITTQSALNLAPRLRMATLYFFAQSLNGRVINTSNASEAYVGWGTRWGDTVGDYSPLGNIPCTIVMGLGDALGLPKELTHKTPADGLTMRSDEDNLGFRYCVLDHFIITGEKIETESAKQDGEIAEAKGRAEARKKEQEALGELAAEKAKADAIRYRQEQEAAGLIVLAEAREKLNNATGDNLIRFEIAENLPDMKWPNIYVGEGILENLFNLIAPQNN